MQEVHICISGVSPKSVRVKFVYEGHWVKVKVKGAKKVDNNPAMDTCTPAQIRIPAVWKFQSQ